MSIRITSSSDSPEAVTAAVGGLAQVKPEKNESAPAADEAESETAEESEPSEQEDEGEESESSEEGDEDSQEDERPKKKNGFKKKIDKLNKRISQAREEAEYWRQQALKGQGANQEPQRSTPKQAEPSDKPHPDNFDSHAEYVEALAEWKLERKLQERDTKAKEDQLKQEFEAKTKAFQGRLESFKEAHDDFDDVIEDVDHIPMSITVQEAILSSDNGPGLMYELAKNPEEYARICQLPATQALRAIGRIEARMENASAPKKEIKTTKAPKPINPVGAKTGSTRKSIFDPDLSQDDYERLRWEQMKRKG
jgi:hypothetical protein